jgi:Tfp pilus assembly protein FimT
MRLAAAVWGFASHKKGAGAHGDPPYDCSVKRAFSLPELMLLLAVMGILLGIGVTTLVQALDRIGVETAATRLVAAHQRARMMAVTRGKVLVLSVDSSHVTISPRDGPPPLWSESGPAAYGVTLTGPTRRFTFSPEGITLGLSNASLQLDRGSSTRTVVVSRLGRVRVLR